MRSSAPSHTPRRPSGFHNGPRRQQSRRRRHGGLLVLHAEDRHAALNSTTGAMNPSRSRTERDWSRDDFGPGDWLAALVEEDVGAMTAAQEARQKCPDASENCRPRNRVWAVRGCGPFACAAGPSRAWSWTLSTQLITPTKGIQAWRDVFATGVRQQPVNQRVSPLSVRRRQRRYSCPTRSLT
jgi:hypothetical protein